VYKGLLARDSLGTFFYYNKESIDGTGSNSRKFNVATPLAHQGRTKGWCLGPQSKALDDLMASRQRFFFNGDRVQGLQLAVA
jgi:hypothetical protein